MAIRVTADEVRLILKTTLTDAELDVFIAAASILVDDLLDGEACHSVASLKEVERWLSAYYATARQLELNKEIIGPAEEGYVDSESPSRYWDRAVKLDCSKKLVNQGNTQFRLSLLGGAGC